MAASSRLADVSASDAPPGDSAPASAARPPLSAQAEDRAAEPSGAESSEGQGIPWHFWLLITSTAGYLIWRFVQVIARLFGA